MNYPPCMGGWCPLRDQCQRYEATEQEPAERLCDKGAEREMFFQPYKTGDKK